MTAKEHLIKIILIIRLINKNPYINLEKIGESVEIDMYKRGYKCAISPNTLKRDIKEIREDLGIEIEFSRQYNGYFINPEDFSNDDIERFLEPFDLLNILRADNFLPEYIHLEKSKPKGTEHLLKLIESIKKSKKVRFNYSKYTIDSNTQREVAPYALKEFKGRWYLIGENNGIKTFGVDRISNLECTNIKFEIDPNFNIDNQYNYSFGIYSDPTIPINEVILSFDKIDGNYIKSAPLHHSQEILSDTEAGITIKLRLRITPDFIMELLSRSWSLEVIQPISLKEEIKNIYLKALERNS